jgi:hypothetical protein
MADAPQDRRRFDRLAARITLFQALLQAVSQHGKSRIALEDPERQPITYGRLVLGALCWAASSPRGRSRASMSACCCRMCRPWR